MNREIRLTVGCGIGYLVYREWRFRRDLRLMQVAMMIRSNEMLLWSDSRKLAKGLITPEDFEARLASRENRLRALLGLRPKHGDGAGDGVE